MSQGTMTLFPGSELFELRATHGLPLYLAIQGVYDKGLIIEWPSYVEKARENGWWDFKTYEDLQYALPEALVPKEDAEEILYRMRLWILANPLVRPDVP